MRLSTESSRDEERALETLLAALDAGIEIFDTARSYGLDERDLGHNEKLLARALKSRNSAARVITKCGMRRDGGAWIPDGRARSILEDALASVEALDGVAIDVLLLHAPDPRVSITTSARALARAQEQGLARRVGLSNVSRKQLEEALPHAAIASVEVALGAFDDAAVRGGVVEFCIARGIEVLAHSPLGGPERARRLARDPELVRIAAELQAAPISVLLAFFLALRPEIVPVVGARRVETVMPASRWTPDLLVQTSTACIAARVRMAPRHRSAAEHARGREHQRRRDGPRAGHQLSESLGVEARYESCNVAAETPNMRRNVRLRCAESAKPALCAASVSEAPLAKSSTARTSRSHNK